MGHTSIVLALLLATLAGFALWLALSNRWRVRTRLVLLAGILVSAAIAHSHSLTRDSADGSLRLERPPIHLHELLHYYLGTRYYPELGHAPLYEAIVIADFEDDPKRFQRRNRFRDLRSNQVDRIRDDVIQEGALAKQRFTPERWDAFKADVALIRSSFISRPAWHRSAILRDHGYNGSPLTTLVLGTLANQPFVSSVAFLQTVRWLDLLLVASICIAVGIRLGAVPALSFGVLWLANPFNDFGYVGGAYLRYNFALALLLAWLSLDAGHLKRAGAWLALAAHFRVFPALFAAGLLLHDLMRPGAQARWRAIREHAPLYVSFAATGAILAAVTAVSVTPPEGNVWQDFRSRISVHAQALAHNAIGVAAPFGYSKQQSQAARAEAYAEGNITPWEDIVAETLAARRPARLAISALLLAATLACARRLPWRNAMFLGFPLLFTTMYSSHDYYLCLGMLALIFHADRAILLALTAGFGLAALIATPTLFDDEVLRFGVLSVVVAITLVTVGALAVRTSARPDEASPA